MIYLTNPEALLLVPVAGVLLLALRWRSRVDMTSTRGAATAGIRLVVIAAAAAALAAPVRIDERPRLARTVALIDSSRSIPEASLDAANAWIEARRAAEPDVPIETVLFASDAIAITAEMPSEVITRAIGPEATSFGPALSRAIARARAELDLRVLLFSDGQVNEGDPVASAASLRAIGAAFDVIPLAGAEAAPPPDQAPTVAALDAPSIADADVPFVVVASVRHLPRADDGEVEAILLIDGEEVARAPVERRSADGAANGLGTARFEIRRPRAGVERLSCVVSGGDADGEARSRFVEIVEGPDVVVLGDDDRPRALRAALSAGCVTARRVALDDALPVLRDARAGTVLIVDAGGAIDAIGSIAPELVRAVERGAGLVVLGSQKELSAKRFEPLHSLLPILPDAEVDSRTDPDPEPPEHEGKEGEGTRIAEVEKEAVTVALMLIIDASGSMGVDGKIDMARVAALAAVDALDPTDRVAVLSFSDRPTWIVPPTFARDRTRIAARLRLLRAEGQTDVYYALREAFPELAKQPVGIRHAILLSDGVTIPARFRTFVERAAERDKITLTTVGIGRQFDAKLLGSLAEWGRGRFYVAREPREIPQVVTLDAKRILSIRKPTKEDDEGSSGDTDPPPNEGDDGAKDPDAADLPAPERAEDLRVRSPHPALAGLDPAALPPLAGIAASQPRAAAWVPIETAEDARPLLAEWRVGAGRVAVFAADFDGEGAKAWRSWAGATAFWTQLVRALAARVADGPSVDVAWTPDSVEISAVETSANSSVDDATPAPTLTLVDETGAPVSLDVRRTEGGVTGRLPRSGRDRRFTVIASGTRGETRRTLRVPGRSTPEDRSRGTDVALLRAVARAGGGRYDPAPAAVPARRPPVQEEESLAPWLLALAAIALVADVAVRRLVPITAPPRAAKSGRFLGRSGLSK